ncbi:MAG: calcium-binding protein [Rhodospirillales bacterium]|nr:calcium-binding protein [Rhodospirillales bacterium]
MTRYLHVGTGTGDTVNIHDDGGIVIADAGDDTVTGGAGRDVVQGGSGADTITGGAGGDMIRGGSGNDIIDGGAGNDVLLGDAGDDTIDGGLGDDHIMGGTGNDTLTGGAGADVFLFVENSGNDTITDFNVSEDMIDLSLLQTTIAFADLTITDLSDNSGVTVTHSALGGTITLTGVSASELTAAHFNLPTTPPSTEYDTGEGAHIVRAPDPWEGTEDADFFVDDAGDTTIRVKGGNDMVLAGEGDDTIDGGAGNDMLFGEEGDDTIHGGAGDDTLYGGSGADAFVFKAGHGNDTIHDFTDGEDTIRIDTVGLTGVTGFADLSIADDNGTAVIDLSGQGGGTIRLEGVSVDDLDASDFAFYDSTMDPDGF